MYKGKFLRFSGHAKDRMRERKIAPEMIEESLIHGTHEQDKHFRDRKLCKWKISRKCELKTVYRESKNSIFVITTFKKEDHG